MYRVATLDRDARVIDVIERANEPPSTWSPFDHSDIARRVISRPTSIAPRPS
jgi:hypothetical protein